MWLRGLIKPGARGLRITLSQACNSTLHLLLYDEALPQADYGMHDPCPVCWPACGLCSGIFHSRANSIPTLAQPRHVDSPLRLYLGEAADKDQITCGAEAYRLVCQDCHGDRRQGLTGDWLQTRDPEDRNCWQSKCHGENYPDDGFMLPYYVPAIIGPNTLMTFQNALELYNYIALNMPWHDPGAFGRKHLGHCGVPIAPSWGDCAATAKRRERSSGAGHSLKDEQCGVHEHDTFALQVSLTLLLAYAMILLLYRTYPRFSRCVD